MTCLAHHAKNHSVGTPASGWFRILITLVFVGLGLGSGSAWSEPKYVLTDLGAPGGINSVGSGINASGQVTGNIQFANTIHAFVDPDGVGPQPMVDLGTLGGSRATGTRSLSDFPKKVQG